MSIVFWAVAGIVLFVLIGIAVIASAVEDDTTEEDWDDSKFV